MSPDELSLPDLSELTEEQVKLAHQNLRNAQEDLFALADKCEEKFQDCAVESGEPDVTIENAKSKFDSVAILKFGHEMNTFGNPDLIFRIPWSLWK